MPLHLYLENAPPADAERAIVNLGYCIKNNAAANIFNKDLDARNYGVSPYGKCICTTTTRWSPSRR